MLLLYLYPHPAFRNTTAIASRPETLFLKLSSLHARHCNQVLVPRSSMDRFEDADAVAVYLRFVRESEGPDAAAEKAKLIVAAAAAVITYDYGPDDSRRILEIIGLARGRSS